MGTTLFRNGTLWLGERPAPRPGWLLVRGERVAGCGAAGEPEPAAEVTVDLGGGHLLPGFCDAHSHLSVGAWLPAVGDGRALRTPVEALAAVRRAAAARPRGAWIVLARVPLDGWPRGPLPAAGEIEAAGEGRPVLLADVTLHRGLLSSEALRRCELGREARDPHGDLVRGPRGEPTGLVWERAFGRALYTALRGLAAEAGDAGVDGLLDREAEAHLRLGITRVHEPGVPPDVHARLAALAARTPLRLSWSATAAAGLLEAPDGAGTLPAGPYGEAPASVKLFLDGAQRCALCIPAGAALASFGRALRAALVERDPRPLALLASQRTRLAGLHLHAPWERFDEADLRARVAAFARAGVAPRLHAIGNFAAAQAARALAAVAPSHATVEHALFAGGREIDLLAACGAVVSTQPGFLPFHGPALRTLGEGASLRALPLRSLLGAGVPLAISSDHPCGPLDPLHNLRLAVTRRLPGGAALAPAEALSPGDALRAATAGGAAAVGFPGEGALSPGAPADLAVCTGDPFGEGSRVASTWVAGRRVWPPAAPWG
jgi:predicted amidohydrolase YtcJ